MCDYKCGDIIHGYVTGIKKYGIFVSIDDSCSGLIHISEISDLYVRNIDDYVQEGEYIAAKVIGVDNNKLKLSIRNFDYRISNNGRYGIEETKSGFSTLSRLLPDWIANKNDELLKNHTKE